MRKEQMRSSAKKLLTEEKLCYSIDETHRFLGGYITRSASARANGRNKPCNESFNIWWRDIPQEELPANMYGNRKISFISVFPVGIPNDYGRGNQFGEIVHDESGEDFLENVLHFFCVKMEQTNRIFELSKRRFNAPAHSVKLLELCRRKSIRIEICHNGFICGICNFEADKAKRQFVKLGG